VHSLLSPTIFIKGVFLSLIFSIFLQASITYADVINSAEDLLEIDGSSESFTLGVDIELSPAVEGNAAYISTFSGILNGDGYTISGLTRPLFHSLNSGSSVSDLELVAHSEGVIGQGILANISSANIVNVDVEGDLTSEFEAGGLVGYSTGEISSSSASGNVYGSGDYVGGLVGYSTGEISSSSASGNVYGSEDYVGGLAGYSVAEISSSSASGDVYGSGDYVGGLVGETTALITNSNAAGDVAGSGDNVGGLAGYTFAGISGSYATGDVVGSGDNVGGLVGSSFTNVSNSYATGDVSGLESVGGLVGFAPSTTSIDHSYATGDVIGSGTYNVGGLVGSSWGAAISNSQATGDVNGNYNVGGLVGWQDAGGFITNTFAAGTVTGIGDWVGGLVGALAGSELTNTFASGNVLGFGYVGGLVGINFDADIGNSYASGDVTGTYDVGGLVGIFLQGDISNSYAAGAVSGESDVGGLVGESYGDIINSYATGDVIGIEVVGGLVGDLSGTIENSYATGVVSGESDVGGLVGFSDGDINIESYATGNVIGVVSVGTLVGFSEGTFDSNFHEADGFDNGSFDRSGPVRNLLSIVNTDFAAPNLPFAVDPRINSGRPYLTSLIDSYVLPSTFSLRSYYTQAAKSLDKALISLGFKSNFSYHPNLGFQALEQNQSNSPAVIQLFEVSEYQNSNILLNKEDGLQLSISSYYKESVEIWTQGLDGEYLYLGLVEFDKDGKAILPTLKFDTANTYQLLMIKAADKLSEKPNLQAQLGQITINVI
jgi:hypothetical protein